MTGKEKCKLLKQIRKEIAESNGIVYLTAECTFEGECRGTCPKCDAEIRYLDDQLQQKAARGEKVSLAGLSLATYESAVDHVEEPSSQEKDFRLSGVMAERPLKEEDEKIGTPDKMGIIFPPPDDGELVTMGESLPFINRVLQMEIEELDLSVRAFNCLTRAGIKTVEELTQMTEEDFKKVRNLGKKSTEEVRQKLQSLGFDFKEDPELAGIMMIDPEN